MKRKFVEVKNDYKEKSSGIITIDAYITDKDEYNSGRVVAWVTPDGEVLNGTSEFCEADDLEDPLVIEAIAEAKEIQFEAKQKVVDDVIEEIKSDIQKGDMTAIDELLMRLDKKSLLNYLPEIKWKDHE